MMFFLLIACALAAPTCVLDSSFILTITGNHDTFERCDNVANVENAVEVKLVNIKKLGNNAFQNFKKIAKFDFGNELEEIGDQAFENIEKSANSEFYLTIPGTVKKIGNNVFKNSKGVNILDIVGNKELVIGDQFFENGNNLLSVTIKGDIKSIGNNAFKNANQCRKLDIKGGIEKVGSQFFENASSLKEVTIEGTIKEMGDNPFKNLNSIEKFTYKGDEVKCPNKLQPNWKKDAKVDIKKPICGFSGAFKTTILLVALIFFFLF